MFSLHRFLVDYDIALLRALAQNRGVDLTTNRQSEAADQLATALLEPLSVRTALARLSPQGQEALEALLSAGGRMRAPHFARRFGEVKPMGPGRLEREVPWQHPANPAEELWYAGFIFRGFAEAEWGSGEFIFVPEDLQPLLPPPRGELPAFNVQTVAPPPLQADDGPAFVQDLFTYLVYLHTRDVRPYADGRLGRRDLTSLRGRLLDAGARRLTFLRHLATHLGFVVRQGEYLRLDAKKARRWLRASTAGQLKVLQDAWRDDPTWNDLCQVPALVCDQKTGWHVRYDSVATRQAFLALLARCPAGAWWSLASLVAAVKDTDPDFLRPDGDYSSWYIRDAASQTYLSGFESWDRVEGALIADLLTGPLRWLGVVASAASQDASPGPHGAICCLTEAGARFLRRMPGEPESLVSPPIVLRPDFRVEVPAPANLYTRFQLARFAELESEDPCRYVLNASGLGRALGRGIRVEQVLAFLRQASEAPVPANVAGQLRLWAGRFGQVQLEEVALLRVKDERVLRELRALPETRGLIDRVLSPTVAVVNRGNLPRLRRALRLLGYLAPPEVEPGGDSAESG